MPRAMDFPRYFRCALLAPILFGFLGVVALLAVSVFPVSAMVVTSTSQPSDGLTDTKMDEYALRNFERWTVERAIENVRKQYSALGYDDASLRFQNESETAYVQKGGIKLAVLKLRMTVISEGNQSTSRLARVFGLRGDKLLSVSCVESNDVPISIFSGTCGQKIEEVFQISQTGQDALSSPLSSRDAPQNRWLCVVEQSTGFRYFDDQEAWKPVDFVNVERYVIRRRNVKEEDGFQANKFDYPWGIFELGKRKAEIVCEDFSEIAKGRLFCTGGWVFDSKTLRIQHYFMGDYINGKEKEGYTDTPYVGIGKCSNL